MTLTRITDPRHPDYAAALALYAISFPPHEQRSAPSQAAIMQDPAYHFTAVYDVGNFVGLVLYWETAEFLYIEHLCIQPSQRNHHFGARVLSRLAGLGKPVILEIDPPADAVSIRRRSFYLRNGFFENPYPHVHPPYHPENHGHHLILLSSPRAITPAEYDCFSTYLRKHVMQNVF